MLLGREPSQTEKELEVWENRSRESLSNRLRKGLAAIFVGTALLSGFASPAHANVAQGGGVGSNALSCAQMEDFYQDVRITPQTGYDLNQYRMYRHYVYDVNRKIGTWGTWIIMGPGEPAHWAWRSLPSGTYRFYAEYSWWNGRAWSPAAGEWITSYTLRTIYGARTVAYCYT